MLSGRGLLLILLLLAGFSASSQRIVYSEPEKDDIRRINFEIIGKVSGNFLVFKSIRRQRPSVIEENGLSSAPVLVVHVHSVFCSDSAHLFTSFCV